MYSKACEIAADMIVGKGYGDPGLLHYKLVEALDDTEVMLSRADKKLEDYPEIILVTIKLFELNYPSDRTYGE